MTSSQPQTAANIWVRGMPCPDWTRKPATTVNRTLCTTVDSMLPPCISTHSAKLSNWWRNCLIPMTTLTTSVPNHWTTSQATVLSMIIITWPKTNRAMIPKSISAWTPSTTVTRYAFHISLKLWTINWRQAESSIRETLHTTIWAVILLYPWCVTLIWPMAMEAPEPPVPEPQDMARYTTLTALVGWKLLSDLLLHRKHLPTDFICKTWWNSVINWKWCWPDVTIFLCIRLLTWTPVTEDAIMINRMTMLIIK